MLKFFKRTVILQAATQKTKWTKQAVAEQVIDFLFDYTQAENVILNAKTDRSTLTQI